MRALTLFLLLATPTLAYANTFHLNDQRDYPRQLGLTDPCECLSTNWTCTLRAAVQTANLCPGFDEILLDHPGPYEVTIFGPSEDLAATGDIDVRQELRIAATVGDEISAAALGERVFHVPNVRGTTFLELDGVTLLDSGNSSAQGGCLLAESARVDLNNTTFDGCAASDGGGAAFVDSDVTFSGSNLTSNEARQGGGVYAENTVLAVTTSSVQSNSAFDGGGLFVLGDGHAVIKESLIHDNVAERAGGGAWIQMATTGIETAIHDNQAIYGGGALVFDAPFVGTQVNVFDNNASRYGGGFYGHQRAEIELDHSSLYGNWGSTGGGGIYTLSLAYLYNSTVHENSAFYGAAVQSVGGSSFVFGNNVSIADNQHLGFIGFAIEGPTIRLRNSIVERHFASCSPSVDSIGYVVSTDNNCLSGGAPGNLSGPANTVAQTVGTERRLVLQPGSIAIDVGNTASCESDDQRFLSRPQGLSCDAGAYELEN